MKDLRILLADDHPLILSGLVNFLSGKGFRKVYSAGDGTEAWRLIKELSPDLCILDIEMPGLTGLEILELCKKANIESKIIFLSYHVTRVYCIGQAKGCCRIHWERGLYKRN